MDMNMEELPITGLCIVEQTCPQGYIMIDKCDDNPKTEADLWKDHIFARKVKRFLCITRVFPLEGGRLNNVLIDICIHEEREPTPIGYSTIGTTQDTGEQAIKRKQLSVKLVPRTQATDAIHDIQFLCRQKKAPTGYTLAGDLNGLTVCFKIGKVPTSSNTAPPVPPRPQQAQTQSLPYGNPVTVQPVQHMGMYGAGDPVYGNHLNHGTANRQNSIKIHPLAGVPFEINPKLTSGNHNEEILGEVRFRSRENIMHEFDYTFNVERQAQETSRSYNGM